MNPPDIRLVSPHMYLRIVLCALALSSFCPDLSAEATTGTLGTGQPTQSYRPTGLMAEQVATSSSLEGGDLVFNPATMLKVSDLRPGMKGFGLTVFSGIRPERFEAEVIGIRHKSMMAGQDIILCRLSSPRLEGIGVVAGMSGSPVFMDGKLIGAVGYGWPGDKVPLAGVTPVEDMIRVLNAVRGPEIGPDGPGSLPLPASPSQTAYQLWMDVIRTRSIQPLELAAAAGNPDTVKVTPEDLGVSSGVQLPNSDMVPLGSPLHLSSASPAARRLMPLLFPGRDFMSASAMGASGGEEARRTLSSPGGPIDRETLAREINAGWGLSVPLVDGDFNLSGVGTVSFRHGQRLVAFAHPMWGRGTSNMPAAGARINTIVHSINRPFKIGESLGQFGTIVQDRLPAIGVMVGREAPMFPVSVTMDDPRYVGKRTLNMRVWKDREQGANYMLMALVECLDTITRTSSDASTEVFYTIRLSDGTEIKKSRFLTDAMGGLYPSLLIAAELGALTNNPFKPVHPESVSVETRTGYQTAKAIIVRAELDRESYRPGDSVQVTAYIRPWRQAEQTLRFQFRIPENLPDGNYSLNITDSARRMDFDLARNPGLLQIHSFEALIKLVGRNYAENRIYATLMDRDTGASVQGTPLESLPASVLGTLAATSPDDQFAPIRGNLIVDLDQPTTYELSGAVSIPVTVTRRKNP